MYNKIASYGNKKKAENMKIVLSFLFLLNGQPFRIGRFFLLGGLNATSPLNIYKLA